MAREYWEDEFLEDEEEQPDIMDFDSYYSAPRGRKEIEVKKM